MIISPQPASKSSRFFAFLIDSCFLSIVNSLSMIFFWYLCYHNFGSATTAITLLGLSSSFRIVFDFYVLILLLIYYIIVPYYKIGDKQKGQTFSKYLLHLQIVSNDHDEVNMLQYLKRVLLGMALLEGSTRFYPFQVYLCDLYRCFTQQPIPAIIEQVCLGIMILSILMYFWKGKLFHDLISHTKVVNVTKST